MGDIFQLLCRHRQDVDRCCYFCYFFVLIFGFWRLLSAFLVRGHVDLLCTLLVTLPFPFAWPTANGRHRRGVRVLQGEAVADGRVRKALSGSDQHHPCLLGGQTSSFQEAMSEGFAAVGGLHVHVDVAQLLVQLVEPVDIGTHGLANLPSNGFPLSKVVVLAVDQVLV